MSATKKQQRVKREINRLTKNGFKGFAHRNHHKAKQKVDYGKRAKLEKIKLEDSLN